MTDQKLPNWILLVNGNTVTPVGTNYHTVTHIQTEVNRYENSNTSTCTQTSAAFEVLDEVEQFELLCLGEEGGEGFP